MRILNRNGSKSPHSRATFRPLKGRKTSQMRLKEKENPLCDFFSIHQSTSVDVGKKVNIRHH